MFVAKKKGVMKRKAIIQGLFAPLCLLPLLSVLAGCSQPDMETSISGQVVTFREESLLWDEPIEVILYKSSSVVQGYIVEKKIIDPPYNFSFETEVGDEHYEHFLIGVETDVPRHASYYAGDSDPVL